MTHRMRNHYAGNGSINNRERTFASGRELGRERNGYNNLSKGRYSPYNSSYNRNYNSKDYNNFSNGGNNNSSFNRNYNSNDYNNFSNVGNNNSSYNRNYNTSFDSNGCRYSNTTVNYRHTTVNHSIRTKNYNTSNTSTGGYNSSQHILNSNFEKGSGRVGNKGSIDNSGSLTVFEQLSSRLHQYQQQLESEITRNANILMQPNPLANQIPINCYDSSKQPSYNSQQNAVGYLTSGENFQRSCNNISSFGNNKFLQQQRNQEGVQWTNNNSYNNGSGCGGNSFGPGRVEVRWESVNII